MQIFAFLSGYGLQMGDCEILICKFLKYSSYKLGICENLTMHPAIAEPRILCNNTSLFKIYLKFQ